VLPREFRDLGLLPNQGEVAAVLILGDVLEIWSADKWVEHARDVRGRLLEITERAFDELENR
jgi:UDP-2,3-diacylglucosamine pyrophosphatase LpxH